MTRIEQIEAELGLITPGPWGYDLNGHVAQIRDDEEWGETVLTLPGTNHRSGRQVDAEFAANAPAHIEAMLPVVKAALAEYDANERYLAIHDECTEEKGQDDDWLEDWMRRDGEALEVWIEVGKAKDAAVRAFKEPRP